MITTGHVFRSRSSIFELELLELEEPNYGRLQYAFELRKDGKAFGNRSINQHSRLIPDLGGLAFESAAEEKLFIPLTSGFLIYDMSARKFIEMPRTHWNSNNRFVSNKFDKNGVVIVMSREVLLFDFKTQNSLSLSFPVGLYDLMDAFWKGENFLIKSKNLSDHKITTRQYCFKLMSLVDESP